MTHAGEGEAGLVSRRLPGQHDPVALHAALADLGAAPLLFRRTGGRALIVADAALRLEATGGEARFEALSEGGALLLGPLAERLANHVTEQAPRHLTVRFERCDHPDEEVRAQAPTALTALRALLAVAVPRDSDEPFALVAAGIVGFDHVDMIEALPPRPVGDFPDLVFLLAETLIAIEPSGTTRVLALAIGSADPAVAHRQHHLAADRLARLVARCETVDRSRTTPAAMPCRAEPDLDDQAFAATVERLKQHIVAGDIFQAVPSRAFRAPCTDPRAAFRRLVAADPSAYHYCFDTGHGTVFGASPETAVELRRGAVGLTLTVSPIAGTRPRGATLDADDRMEADLRLDAKEVAEHLMLVDLARNDVARVATPGTRRVTRMLGVERFARVMHLVSTVEGRLADGCDAIDTIRACLNVGTLSGAPKLAAIALIRAVEQSPRGPYGGAIGWINGNGEMDSAVIIRSALVRDGFAEVRAGAGVVADSDPLSEAAETRAKASAVLAALGAAA
ncbi:MAG: chorismate-binding protein [Sphingomonas bacterium]|nr:chorismate-binding protein [Sphingomonas bacterium]